MKLKINYEIDPTQPILPQIMKNRELDLNWANAGESDLLDFSTAKNYEAGKELILKHINNNSKIGIYVDSDQDGAASSAIMYQWLKDKNPNLELIAIIPEGKVHGILEQLVPEDLDLLIVPDASSNEPRKHKIMNSRNIEVLVLDHHEMEEENPWSVIINPKNKLCQYKNKWLSGSGVVWKFIRQIDLENNSDNYKRYADLAAIGTVGDVMSLKTMENKAIVNLGIQNINNPYFQAYLKADQRVKDKPINPILISFYMVPLVNALIRIGDHNLKESLFRALVGEESAEPIIAQMTSVKGKQDRTKNNTLPRVVMGLQSSGRDKHSIVFAKSPSTLPKSMTGLVAGQLASMYQRPTMLAREEDDFCIGSLRSINGSTVENFKDFCEASGMFEFVAGHQGAAGFKIAKSKVEDFIQYANDNLPPFERIITCDFKLTENKAEVIKQAVEFENHVGCDIPALLIYDEFVVDPSEIQIIGKNQNVLKIEKDGITYIKFNHKDPAPNYSTKYKIVGKPSLNEWNGDVSSQLIIEHLEWDESIL